MNRISGNRLPKKKCLIFTHMYSITNVYECYFVVYVVKSLAELRAEKIVRLVCAQRV